MPLQSYNPGRLDRRIQLLRPYESQSGDGEVVLEWVSVLTVSAGWLPQSGREFEAAQARHAEAVGIWRIRYRSDIDPNWIILYGTEIFDIVASSDVGRKSYIDLVVKNNDKESVDSLNLINVELLHGSSGGGSHVLLEDDSNQLQEPSADEVALGDAEILHDGGTALLHAGEGNQLLEPAA